jgi:hypothetical protein
MLPPISGSSTNPSERRRHRRISVLQSATLKMNDLPDSPCEIRDYCRSGVFASLEINDARIRMLRQHIGNPVAINFVAACGKRTKNLFLQGILVRVANTGLGIAFDPPEQVEALRALDAALMKATPRHSQRHAPSELEQACIAALDACISELLYGLDEKIYDGLMEGMEGTGTGAEQSAFFEATVMLKDFALVATDFRARVLEQAIHHSVATEPESAQQPLGKLSLVNTQAFEDWLNLLAEAAKLEAIHAESLQELLPRLSRLAGVQLDAKHNPYGPAAVVTAFGATLNSTLSD